MARPKQKKELKRSHKITFMMNESEYNQAYSEASELGITLSTYIRAKTLSGYIRVPKYAKVNADLVGQLSKMGGLIKTFYNETGGLHKEKTGVILDKLIALIDTIQEQVEDDREAHRQSERP
jgi:hypothetical protein